MWCVQALSLLKKNGEVIPLGLLNNIGVLHFERGELEVKQLAHALCVKESFLKITVSTCHSLEVSSLS
jgi:hypothetical protein